MDDLGYVSTDRLLSMQECTADTLLSLIDEINVSDNVLGVLREMMAGGDVLKTVANLSSEEPEATRMTLEACLTGIANLQEAQDVNDELQRRALLN